MLSEEAIELLPERIYQRLNRINNSYLEAIGTRIKEIGEMKPSDIHRVQQMFNYSADVDKITADLAKASEKNISDIYEIFDIVAKENYDYSKPFYEAKNLKFIPYEQNYELQGYVSSLAEQTVDEYKNLTQHTAFAVYGDGNSIAPLFENNKNKVPTSLSDTYTRVIDDATTAAQLGINDYQSVIRKTLKALADSGIRNVDYATGYTRRLDTAVRQNVLWGIKQCNQNTADRIGREFGADGYEISYHSNPRPSHEEMGGKQYAIGKARTINGKYYPSFSSVEGLLKDFGCLHFKFSILLGISPPAHKDEELAQFKSNDKETFKFEGKKYTKYEASQVQRKLESEMRRQKDRANIAKAAGDDDMRRKAQHKINQLTNKYKQFSHTSGLPTKMERASVAGFRRVKTKDQLTKKSNNDILFVGKPIIPIEKFTNYALDFNKQPNKAKAFNEALGYTIDNASDLINNIYDNINFKNLTFKKTNEYGHIYQYVVKLTGANGKQANVCTGWIIDKEQRNLKLTSAYITNKKVTKND